MSKRGGCSRLELRLNLSPSPTAREAKSSSLEESAEFSTSEMTAEGSCVSSENVEQQQQQPNMGTTHEETTRAMVLVGCPRCLMYVMLSEVNPDPKCPKCNSTVALLDFRNEQNSKKQDAP